jgi:hypothetical protein
LPTHIYSEGETKNNVAEVRRAIYGLSQSPMLWNAEFHKIVKKEGFLCSDFDPCLYFKMRKDDSK